MSSLFEDIAAGRIGEVHSALVHNRKLANSRGDRRITPLMKAASVQKSATAISLINDLMANGASIESRDDDGHNVLLYACRFGADPSVIECIMDWNSRKNSPIRWKHCVYDGFDGTGPFTLACASSNKALILYILQKRETLRLDYDDDNIDKGLYHAIQNSEQAAIILADCVKELAIGNELAYSFSTNWPLARIFDDGFNEYSREIDVITYIIDVITLAFGHRMFDLISRLHSIKNLSVDIFLWVDKNKQLEQNIRPSFSQIARDYFRKEAWKLCKPVFEIGKALETRELHQDRLVIPDDNLNEICSYLVDYKTVRDAAYFQKHAEFCDECEASFLPYTCYCCNTSFNYDSD